MRSACLPTGQTNDACCQIADAPHCGPRHSSYAVQLGSYVVEVSAAEFTRFAGIEKQMLLFQARQQFDALPCAWMGGQGTLPYEQKTQQSPGNGLSNT